MAEHRTSNHHHRVADMAEHRTSNHHRVADMAHVSADRLVQAVLSGAEPASVLTEAVRARKFRIRHKRRPMMRGRVKVRSRQVDVGRVLNRLRPKLVAAAQAVLDAWEPDEEGYDEVYGSGGACDDVADAMADVVIGAGLVPHQGGQDGDDHAFLIVTTEDNQQPHRLDIPPGVYETGGGYNWQKRDGVRLSPRDVVIQDITGWGWAPDEW